MSLEQRVKKLEDEVKILKNQIQNTLLEIQAEIMSHYYTSLRAEDGLQEDEHPRGHRDSPDSGNGRKERIPAPSQEQKATHTEQAAANPAPPHAPNSTPGKRAEAPAEQPSQESGNPAVDSVDWASFARLTKWVSGTTKEIGAANARKVIETCQAQGYSNGHMLESLLTFVPLEEGKEDETRDSVSTDKVLEALAELTELLARKS